MRATFSAGHSKTGKQLVSRIDQLFDESSFLPKPADHQDRIQNFVNQHAGQINKTEEVLQAVDELIDLHDRLSVTVKRGKRTQDQFLEPTLDFAALKTALKEKIEAVEFAVNEQIECEENTADLITGLRSTSGSKSHRIGDPENIVTLCNLMSRNVVLTKDQSLQDRLRKLQSDTSLFSVALAGIAQTEKIERIASFIRNKLVENKIAALDQPVFPIPFRTPYRGIDCKNSPRPCRRPPNRYL